MKLDPTSWLRAMARRQKLATGGYIDTSTSLLPTESGCDYTVPPTATKPAADIAVELREPTPEQVEQMATALGVIPLGPASREQTQRIADQIANEKTTEAKAEAAVVNCPCLAIYSRCYPQFHGMPDAATVTHSNASAIMTA